MRFALGAMRAAVIRFRFRTPNSAIRIRIRQLFYGCHRFFEMSKVKPDPIPYLHAQ
jgi:hypothetical protein